MINDHVVSLDLAKQLYEAGIKIESEFLWARYEKQWVVESKPFVKRSKCDEIVPAPLASELGEVLPQYLVLEDGVTKYSCNLDIARSSAWRFYYGDPKHNYSIKFTASGGITEVNSRAEFVLYLKEKGLL